MIRFVLLSSYYATLKKVQGLEHVLKASKIGTFNVSKAWNALEHARTLPDSSRLVKNIPNPDEMASTSNTESVSYRHGVRCHG